MSTSESVQRDIKASPDDLWKMVSDVTRMGEWSPENVGGRWSGDKQSAEVGARFKGKNRAGWRRWSTTNTVVGADPGKSFAFETTTGPFKISRWEYRFEPLDEGCRITETWTDLRGKPLHFAGRIVSGVADRASHNRAGMEATLERLAAAAELS